MRITCDVDIVSRLLPSHNLKKPGRSIRTQLSIGKKTGPSNKDGTVFLMLCTAKDRNGTKFVLKENVEQIFGRFVSEGKATIRLMNPPQDLCLSKADPLQLKSFLSLVKVGGLGKGLENVTLSSLSIPSAKKVEKPKTKLVILQRKDYPITTNFPSSLEHLKVSQCSMKRVDSRILQLRHLQVLNLEQNILQSFPEGTEKLTTLRELHLGQNQLSKFPVALFKGTIPQTLAVLDLSNNGLMGLPPDFCLLRNLVTLKLDHNKLAGLPPTIGRLGCLRFLSLSHNELKCLPASFLKLRLESLDMFGNPFDTTEKIPTAEQMEFPTLMEVAARAIKTLRLRYDQESLHGHLCQYLDSSRQCWCGKFCFQCCVRYVTNVDLHKLSQHVTGLDLYGRTQAPLESFLCSRKCLQRFQDNPRAYWRK